MGLVSNSNTGKVEYLIDLEGGKGGSAKQSTLLSITTTPSGTFEKGSQYYNSNTRLIYTAVEDNTWTDAKTSDPEFGTVYIYDDNGTTEYYQWDGDNLVETDLEKYQLVNNISQDFEEDSETKYPSSKALSDGLKSLKTFPTVVTDSGSSLPSASGYQLNDTFLNTSDKKIYKTNAIGYQLNSGTSNNDNNVVINLETGLASNFGMTFSQYVNIYRYISRTESLVWSGNKTIDFHFKLSEGLDDTHYYPLFDSSQYGFNFVLFLKSDGLYFVKYKVYQSSFEFVSNTKILDFSWQSNTEYYLRLDKVGANTTVSLSNTGYDTNNIKEETVAIEDFYGYYQSASTTIVLIGTTNSRLTSNNINLYNGITPIQVYLLDTTTKNYLVPATDLSWDSGTSLTDKTEYADKTNGALYLYSDDELVKIGGSLTKKVYTISADNTSTLDVSSDFTRIVDVLKNGVELAITDDYTISSGVITFVTALSTMDKITVKGE